VRELTQRALLVRQREREALGQKLFRGCDTDQSRLGATMLAPPGLWQPEGVYLDTASYGLPPRTAWDALQEALEDWRCGRTSWEGWCDATERARALFARMVGVPPERVAVGGGASPLVSLVAGSLPEETRVLAPDVEFSSLIWPWVAHGADVRVVPLARLAEHVDGQTDVVAVSAAQSATGEVADLDAIVEAARTHHALLVVDATHGCGWLPLDGTRFDALVCSAYKWLLSPRGTAFLALGERLLERVRPLAANWYAAGGAYGTYYGLEMPLPDTAGRLDISPAWFSWVGTAPALEALLEIGIERIHEHDVALANRFRAGLGLEPSNSAIVKAEVADAEGKLRRAGIRAATRAGSLRASFHVYNTEADVDEAVAALSG
jgi:selenocysteine lyase/cysteine desulfurase